MAHRLERIAQQRGKRVEQIVEEALDLYEAETQDSIKPHTIAKLKKEAVADFFKKLGTGTAEALGETGRKKRASAGGMAKAAKMTDAQKAAWNVKMLESRRKKKKEQS